MNFPGYGCHQDSSTTYLLTMVFLQDKELVYLELITITSKKVHMFLSSSYLFCFHKIIIGNTIEDLLTAASYFFVADSSVTVVNCEPNMSPLAATKTAKGVEP